MGHTPATMLERESLSWRGVEGAVDHPRVSHYWEIGTGPDIHHDQLFFFFASHDDTL